MGCLASAGYFYSANQREIVMSTDSRVSQHIVLTSHPTGDQKPIEINWGATELLIQQISFVYLSIGGKADSTVTDG